MPNNITITLPTGNIIVGTVDFTPEQGEMGPRGLRGPRGYRGGATPVSTTVHRDDDGKIDQLTTLQADNTTLVMNVQRDGDGAVTGLVIADYIEGE